MDGDNSARLDLPYLAAGQLQKHVTLNEALTRLDALVQCAAVSRTTAAQPASPADGALYILPAGATGPAWASHGAGALMRAEMGGWTRIETPDGLRVWVKDEDRLVIRDDGGWVPLGERIGALQQLTRLGLGTGADAGNPFAAKLNTALWTARGVGEGGDGDLRMTLNKEAPADVLSLLFQSGWGGRAELGLIGDDDLTLKVSPDGGSWRAAMVVDRTSGAVAFPAGAGRVETTVFSANGTWAVPAWARRIEAAAVGGGGGGGAGACGASGVARFGGGGGGAGGVAIASWNAADLAASLSIAIGAAGASGPGGAAPAGAPGGPGGLSTISSGGLVILTGRGGGGGQGGTATALDVEQVQIGLRGAGVGGRTGRAGHGRLVVVDARGRLAVALHAAQGDALAGRAAHVDGQAGHLPEIVVQVGRALIGQGLPGNGRDADRHVLQRLIAALGGDDDLVDGRGLHLLFARGRVLGHGGGGGGAGRDQGGGGQKTGPEAVLGGERHLYPLRRPPDPRDRAVLEFNAAPSGNLITALSFYYYISAA